MTSLNSSHILFLNFSRTTIVIEKVCVVAETIS